MNNRLKIFLILWFYIGWLGSVYSKVWNLPLVSLVFPIVAFMVLKTFTSLTSRNFLFLSCISILGFTFDFIALKTNLISIPNLENNVFYTVWLFSIWLLFSSVLPIMAPVFKSRLGLAAILGGTMGPLSYYYGQFFDVLILNNPISILIYCIFWSLFFPFIIFLQRTRYEH